MVQTLEAIRLDKVLTAGRTKPILVSCLPCPESGDEHFETDDAPGNHRLVVVKALGHPEITEGKLFNELFGNLLARSLGVNTPKPYLINISKEFTQITNTVISEHGFQLKPGIGVGCEYLNNGYKSPIHGAALTPEELAQATLIYGFDLMTQNIDRRIEKPNCLHGAGGFFALDFEMCFSFLQAILNSTRAWEVSSLKFSQNHLFRQSLARSKAIDWAPLIQATKSHTEEALNLFAAAAPESWQYEFSRIKEHLLSIIGCTIEFELELQRSLK